MDKFRTRRDGCTVRSLVAPTHRANRPRRAFRMRRAEMMRRQRRRAVPQRKAIGSCGGFAVPRCPDRLEAALALHRMSEADRRSASRAVRGASGSTRSGGAEEQASNDERRSSPGTYRAHVRWCQRGRARATRRPLACRGSAGRRLPSTACTPRVLVDAGTRQGDEPLAPRAGSALAFGHAPRSFASAMRKLHPSSATEHVLQSASWVSPPNRSVARAIPPRWRRLGGPYRHTSAPEIVGGVLRTLPRLARGSALTIAPTNLGEELGPPFERRRGGPVVEPFDAIELELSILWSR